MDIDSIKLVIESLEGAGSMAIAEYTKWYFISAVVYVLFGVSLITYALIATFKFEEVEPPGEVKLLIRATLVVIGLLFILCNLTDIFAPDAIGTYKFIRSIVS